MVTDVAAGLTEGAALDGDPRQVRRRRRRPLTEEPFASHKLNKSQNKCLPAPELTSRAELSSSDHSQLCTVAQQGGTGSSLRAAVGAGPSGGGQMNSLLCFCLSGVVGVGEGGRINRCWSCVGPSLENWLRWIVFTLARPRPCCEGAVRVAEHH